MKKFHWSGYDSLGRKEQGIIIGYDHDTVKLSLLERNYQNIRLQRLYSITHKATAQEISDMFQQLALLLEAHIPLKSALKIVQKNSLNIALYCWFDELLHSIEQGYSFSSALKNNEMYISYQERQLIHIGEKSGQLSKIIAQISEEKLASLKLKQKVQKIMLYPSVVLFISLILTALLLIFVVPKFALMYQNSQQQLPTLTSLLLVSSKLIREHAMMLMGIVIITALIYRYLLQKTLRQSYSWRRFLYSIFERVPLLSAVKKDQRAVLVASNLSLMLNAGLTLNQALESFLDKGGDGNQITGDMILNLAIKQTLEYLHQGHSFAMSIDQRLFAQQAQQMIDVGEKSGRLATMLGHVATNTKQRLEHRIELLSQLLEPIMMVIIGTLIGIIMLGMYLPIFNMGSIVGG